MMSTEAMFVKLETYDDVLGTISMMKTKLEQAKSTLDKLKEIKKKEEIELELWEKSIHEIEGKLITIESSLAKK